MTTKTKRGFGLHRASIALAEDTVKQAIHEDDGELCFNLPAFLDAVESRLDTVWSDSASPLGRFELDATGVARYLWCCLALDGGDRPDGTTFRGMPILD